MRKLITMIATAAAGLTIAASAGAVTFVTIHVTSMSYDGPSSFPGITPDSLASGTVVTPVDDITNPHPSGLPAENIFGTYGGVTDLTIDTDGTGAGFVSPIFGLVNGDPWVVTHDFTVDVPSMGTIVDIFSSNGGNATVADYIAWAASQSGNSGQGGPGDPMVWQRFEWAAYAFSGLNGIGETTAFTVGGDDPYGAFEYAIFGTFGMDALIPCSTCMSGVFEDYTISGGAYSNRPIQLGDVLEFEPGIVYTIRMSGSCSNCAPSGTIDFVQTIVPVPAAAWLFGSALGLLGWMRKRVALRPVRSVLQQS